MAVLGWRREASPVGRPPPASAVPTVERVRVTARVPIGAVPITLLPLPGEGKPVRVGPHPRPATPTSSFRGPGPFLERSMAGVGPRRKLIRVALAPPKAPIIAAATG